MVMASSCEQLVVHHLNGHRECDICFFRFSIFLWIMKYFPRKSMIFIQIYREIFWCLLPSVSRCVFSWRETQCHLYCTCAHERTTYSSASTSLPGKVPLQTPRVQVQPLRFTSWLLCELVPTQLGLEPKILCWKMSIIRITL